VPGFGVANAAGFRKMSPPFTTYGSTPGTRSGRRLARDPAEHIRIVLFGLAGKAVSGKQFAGKMPAFAELLTDEEIAAVINHERTNWGNRAPTVTPEDVKKIREK
jgi:mono/diheme cytochrome c family protein